MKLLDCRAFLLVILISAVHATAFAGTLRTDGTLDLVDRFLSRAGQDDRWAIQMVTLGYDQRGNHEEAARWAQRGAALGCVTVIFIMRMHF